jgi:UDP-galactopyranose mutase
LLAVQLRRALSRIGARSSILWSYTPHFVDLGRAIGAELVVYYRVDDYTTSPYIDTAYVIRQEAKAVAAADLCVAVNRKSADLMKDARARILVPNGIDLAVYGERGDEDDPVPWIGHPRLVFTGTFDTWVDLGLLSGLASLRPDWQIVLAGEEKVALDDLAALPNVHYLGLLPYGELPALMSHCDIGLVPYHVNDFTMSASIGKIFQYLATGLPVLSTPVLDAADYGDHVTTAPTDAAGFVEAAGRVLAADSPDERCARRSYGLAQTWTNRFDALESEIGRRLARSG